MALPESVNLGHDAEYEDLQANIQSYLGKVNGGRAIRVVDPRQPAFGDDAERLRQVAAIDAANRRAGNEPDLPESVDLGDGNTDTLPDSIDLTEGNSVRSKGIGERVLDTYQSYRPDWSQTSTNIGESGVRDALNILGEIGAPFATARDYMFGVATGKPGEAVNPAQVGDIFSDPKADHTDWKTNVIPALMETLAELAIPMKGKSAPRPTVGQGAVVEQAVPKVISPTDLDAIVATRDRGALDTKAFPDITDFPSRKVETGNTIVTPSLEPGVHGQSGKLPTTEPGLYGTSEQMDLLGGYNVLGDDLHLTGRYVLRPGEQLNPDMKVLRPQYQFIEGAPAEQTNLLNRRLLDDTKGERGQTTALGLKARVLSPDEERLLTTPAIEQGGTPISVKYSASGKSASVGYEESPQFALPELPSDLTVGNTANGAVLPKVYAELNRSALEAAKARGPAGQGVASLLNAALNNRAALTSSNFVEGKAALEQILGIRGGLDRKLQGLKEFVAGENPFIFGMKRYFNMTEAEQESLFNHMYSNGKIEPLNDRVRQAARVLFEKGTYPASADPYIRGLMITNPFTGEKMPLGEPNMFMPQQPIAEITRNAINEKQWKLLYERKGGEKLGMDWQGFRDMVVAFSKHDPEVTALKMKGLENMRLLDLEALGGSPYQWAKKLGYETDPFRAAFRFNSMARLRGQFAQIEEPINNMLALANPEDRHFLKSVVDRTMMRDTDKYDMLKWSSKLFRGIGRAMDVGMLQLSFMGNTTQISYPIARAGVGNSMKGLISMFNGADREIIEKSGALFPSMLNELSNPTGALARWDSMVMRGYGVSKVDRATRYFAGHVGHEYIKSLEKELLTNPTNQKAAKLINELGGNAKALLETGKLPDDMRYNMIQQFTNYTAGVTDVRGLPLYATSQNPLWKLINKYRSFAQANMAEVDRLVRNSPDGATALRRGITLLLGAEVMGGGMNVLRQGLYETLSGESENPDKSSVQFALENLVMGLGAFPGMLAVQAYNQRPEAFAVSLGLGAPGGQAVSFFQDFKATVKNGFGWRTVDTASKRIPFAGPVTGPLVHGEVKSESKRDAYMKQLTEGDD